MTNAEAIKTYFSSPNKYGTERAVTNQELMALKKGIPQSEWDEMAKDCLTALNQKAAG